MLLLLFLSSMLVLTNCRKDSTEPDTVVYPDSNLSFIQHIHPIFESNCASSGCHQVLNPASGLELETLSPSFMANSGLVVVPFSPYQSRLYRLLLGPENGYSRMPKNRAPLSENQARAIRIWIEEGAITNK